MTAWRIRGPYFESCNCDAICSCRMIGGRPGSRAQYRYCQFALGWSVAAGHHGEVDLAGRAAVIIGYWDEEERGAPWRVGVYVDSGADQRGRELLAAILTGREGGNPARQYGAAISEVLFIEPAEIEIVHEPAGRQSLKVGGHVQARARERVPDQGAVTCGIPGHDRQGYEVVMEELTVRVPGLEFEYQGRCGFAATFDYRSD